MHLSHLTQTIFAALIFILVGVMCIALWMPRPKPPDSDDQWED